jgi:hypothetical protein
MIFLLWTAADLTNASLCAIDSNEGGISVAVGLAATLGADTTTQNSSQPSHHVDDCFCCSHCVDVKVLTPPLLVEPVAHREPPVDFAVPISFGSSLYHPPLV